MAEETKTKARKKSAQDTVTITAPWAEAPDHYYLPRHVDLGGMTFEQRTNLRNLFHGMNEKSVMKNGKPVTAYTDVIKYLLENVTL